MKIYYSESHEYVKVDGEYGYVGVSEYAAKQLGAVTYVDMPEEGDEITKGDDFGAIESRKAASDLIAPVSGEVVETNEELVDNPRLINNDALSAWIIKVKMVNFEELDDLMDQAAYDEYCAKEQH